MSASAESTESALAWSIDRVAPELYFLVAKFLSHGPLKRTAEVLREELEDQKVLPTRLDWEGRTHDQTFEELECMYRDVPRSHLLEVCATLLRRSERDPRVSLLSRSLVEPPRKPTDLSQHIVRRLVYREEGRRPWHTSCAGSLPLSGRMLRSLELQRRTLGHLSAVYCLQYDRTGEYLVTGADDLLVKVWSARDGRLLLTCRGAASEITDICVSSDNRLLCAGSLDRHIRVWDLQTGAPVAVLQGHSGMITSVHFCPGQVGDLRCLVSTSTDGSVAFWTYSQSGPRSKASFISKPVQYMERMRPGACHMICCCWSPGGAFLAAGSADHHVRVYMMAHEGPRRILEVAAHSDAVDSLAWCHRGLRFLSGSKDGTAILWQLHATQWRHTPLHMTQTLPGEPPPDCDRFKVTMVCWSCDDGYIVTAASDHTIKVWCAHSCRLLRVLRGHSDETYVLEAHPTLPHILLSASHDGQVVVWDIASGELLMKFLNRIDGQGHGAVYDAKWSPCGARFAATDSQGHLLYWGLGRGDPLLTKLPTELFFHTDYRPLVRDAAGGVLDEQTEVPPHLMPPPFLVDVEGAPHPPALQRLVPGREHLALDQLIPTTGEGEEAHSHIDRMIALVLRDMDAAQAHANGEDAELARLNGVVGGIGGVWRGEGVRHTAGTWQREPLDARARGYVAPLEHAHYEQVRAASEEMSQLEMSWYRREMRRRPLMISTAEVGVPSGPRRKPGRRANNRRPPRPPVPPPRPLQVHHDEEEEELSDHGTPDETTDTSDTSVRLSVGRGHSSDTDTDDSAADKHKGSSSSDYSDWVADLRSVRLAPPQRSRRRCAPRRRYSPPPPVKQRNAAAAALHHQDEPSSSAQDDRHLHNGDEGPSGVNDTEAERGTPEPVAQVELPEQYRPSEWLCATEPRKAPYHPQMGDECYYFKQGHMAYFDAVAVKDVYKMTSRDKPWERTHINAYELVKVVGVKYLLRPPRLVCLKLALLAEPGRSFSIKYHDMPDVIDFLVLKQQYDACVARSWTAGDRFRCMIDDMWWTGSVVEALTDARTPDAHFLSLRVRWDNGEYERLSPWDLEPVDPERLPADMGGCTPVLASELEAVLYRPRCDEWPPDGDRARATQAIARALDQVMELAVAEPFVAPVDLNLYPVYAYVVEYPIDLSTIKARFENQFYRRVAAAQFDVRYLATNAEKFNRPHSHIIRQARIVTDLLLNIVADWQNVDVMELYRKLNDDYRSSDSAASPDPSAGRIRKKGGRRRRRRGRSRDAAARRRNWQAECQQLMRELMSSADAQPFLQPVSEDQAPGYRSVVTCPMDLGTAASRLQMGAYARPDHFARDVRLVFANSRLYNTNERSRIYAMTTRLSALFEDLYQSAVPSRAARLPRRRKTTESDEGDEVAEEVNVSEEAQEMPAREEYSSSDEETLASQSRRRADSGTALHNGHHPPSDTDSDVPLTLHHRQGKGKGVGKKSKPGSASATADDASTSRDANSTHTTRSHNRVPRLPDPTGDSTTEYEDLEVLEEEVVEDEVEVTYESANSRSGHSQSVHTSTRYEKRHRRRRRHGRKRHHDSDYTAELSPPSRRHRQKRKKAERAESPPSSSSSGSGGGAPEEPPARYESDHSYRPRLSSDDSAPLHTYRRSRGDAGAVVSAARVRGGGGARRRRPGPAPRYNEDSEEDSIAAISKRLREHTTTRTSRLRGAGATGGAANGARGGARRAATDHDYYTQPSTSQHNGNNNSSDGEDSLPLSISSRGRVRRLTAKARGLLPH